MDYPYTFISCPCTNINATETEGTVVEDEEDEEGKTFDPRSPRANFALYPLEHLLYCEDCQQIRCPRCINEEIVCWYCPSCLFEMPTSLVKSEGGRCTRNCFDCPICTSPLAVSSTNPDPTIRSIQGPWILGCSYCRWSSLDIGWQFEKNTGLHNTIAKLSIESAARRSSNQATPSASKSSTTLNGDIREESCTDFTSLRRFYNSQRSDATPSNSFLSPSGGLDYSSPGNIARILSIYTGKGHKRDGEKGAQMREALSVSEGLHVHDQQREEEAIERIKREGWRSTTSLEQRNHQPQEPFFINDLRPTQPLLRTKRGKRCRTCRHILVKPEPKVLSTRFKIKLVALNYIPTILLKPLQPAPSTQHSAIDLNALPPLRACQFLLTFKNPLFEAVKITLATPAQTPGRFQHRVTILCPDFSIGSNVDQWDEALASSKEKRLSRHFSLTKSEYAGEGGRVAEAGKVWEKGRNWTTVVLEVACADLGANDDHLNEDEDVLEIPIFVRMDWEAETQDAQGKTDAKREKRELAYWSVLGVGRIAKM